MAYRRDEDGDHEAELGDREDPDPQDADWDLDPATAECAFCGEAISEDAQVCPECGNYLADSDWTARKPWWVIVGVVMLVIVILMVWSRW